MLYVRLVLGTVFFLCGWWFSSRTKKLHDSAWAALKKKVLALDDLPDWLRDKDWEWLGGRHFHWKLRDLYCREFGCDAELKEYDKQKLHSFYVAVLFFMAIALLRELVLVVFGIVLGCSLMYSFISYLIRKNVT